VLTNCFYLLGKKISEERISSSAAAGTVSKHGHGHLLLVQQHASLPFLANHRDSKGVL